MHRFDKTRVAIVTRSRFRSPRYLAKGLQRMLARCEVAVDCYVHGLSWLEAIKCRNESRRHAAVAAFADLWLKYLRRYDVIVVSDTIGIARDAILLEPLRLLAKPLLLYEVFALSGSKYFLDQMPKSALSQFDAFLVSSAIHDDPLVEGPPIFEIGLELLEPPTTRQAKPIAAMLDFGRPGYEADRQIQVDTLENLDIPQFSLDGEYSFTDIVAEYDKAAAAFLAFPEAFGIPIAQLQNRGSIIVAPHRHWAKRHALLPSGSVFADENAPFTDNFVFYSDKADLKEKLCAVAENYRPDLIAKRFRDAQPHLVSGNLIELNRALEYARQARRH